MRHRKAFSMSIGGLGAASIVCTALLISLAPSSQAADLYDWDTGDGSWASSGNWSGPDSNYPGDTTNDKYDRGRIWDSNGSDAGDVAAGVTVDLSTNIRLIDDSDTIGTTTDNGEIKVGSTTSGSPATLNIKADVTGTHIEIVNETADKTKYGTINHTSGTVDFKQFRVATNVSGSEGTYNFGSSTSSGAPTFTMDGYGGRGYVGSNGTGTLSLSGYGSFSGPDGAMRMMSGGEIRIKGGNLSKVQWNGQPGMKLNTGSTYTAVLTSTGITPSTFGSTSDQLRFEGGEFNLETDGYNFSVDDTFTIIEGGDIESGSTIEFPNLGDGEIIQAGGNDFEASYTYDYDGEADRLTITAVPEPSSLMLLGLAGLLLMRRRRL